MVGIDTNVLVMFFVSPAPTETQEIQDMHAAAVDLINNKLTPSNRGFVSTIAVLELYFTLKKVHNLNNSALMNVIQNIVNHPHLDLENVFWVTAAIHTATTQKCGFQDCLIFETCKGNGATTTYTFDKKAAQRAGMTLLK